MFTYLWQNSSAITKLIKPRLKNKIQSIDMKSEDTLPIIAKVMSDSRKPIDESKLIGNYVINPRFCLGEGSYGKVYIGTENGTGQQVAIKQIDIRNIEKDEYIKSSLISEIDLMKQLNHPNILRFIELVKTQRNLYIVTEYCRDGDLRDLIQNRKISELEAIEILLQIIEGFRELLKHNIIHRDLKPANILINGPLYKIADFGFAKFVNNFSSHMLRTFVGSPLYMAPQILSRKPYTTKSDIWSMGIIFFEMLYGEVPWKGQDEQDLLRNIYKYPLKLNSENPKLSDFSEEFLRRALMIEEKDRMKWEDLFILASKVKPNIMKERVPSLLRSQASSGSKKKSIFNPDILDDNEKNSLRKLRTQEIPRNFNEDRANLISSTVLTRTEYMFKHYIGLQFHMNSIALKELFGRNEGAIEKMLLLISQSAGNSCKKLYEDLQDKQTFYPEIFMNSKELNNLLMLIKSDHQFYRRFHEDMMEKTQISGLLQYIRTDPSIAPFLTLEFTTERLVDEAVMKFGRTFAQEAMDKFLRGDLIGYVKVGREILVTIDYLLDLLILRGEIKGLDVAENLHLEKSDIQDHSLYREKVILRLQKFLIG